MNNNDAILFGDVDNNDNNNNNNPDVVVRADGLVPEHLRIEDLDGWLERNGLPFAADAATEDTIARQEERARVAASDGYAESLHQRFFADWEHKEHCRREERRQQLADLPATTMVLIAAEYHDDHDHHNDDTTTTTTLAAAEPNTSSSSSSSNPRGRLTVPLLPMASTCDTIFALVSSWKHFQPRRHDPVEDDNNNNNSNDDDDVVVAPISLSLIGFGIDEIRVFVELCVEQANVEAKAAAAEAAVSSTGSSSKNSNNKNTSSSSSSLATSLAASWQRGGLPLMIDCIRMAHYLQNTNLLEECINYILEENIIDTDNCLMILQLADHLQLPRLFERALAFMMESVENVAQLLEDDQQQQQQQQQQPEQQSHTTTSNANTDNTTCTSTSTDNGGSNYYLTLDLRQRIQAIQAAIQTSLHSNRSRLYFSSLDEYIAIFAERVQYYEERLAEAQEQQDDRMQQTQTQTQQSRAWQDAQQKLERQRVRVHTLKAALKEQKRLFTSRMELFPDGKKTT
jgi:hypothetical protein